MTDNQYNYDALADLLSVSGGDHAASGIISIPEEIGEILSVSGGDNISAEDGITQSNIYILTLPQDVNTDVSAEVTYTIWDKPLDEYSVSEGLLLIIVTLAAFAFIWGMVKGGFSWLDW